MPLKVASGSDTKLARCVRATFEGEIWQPNLGCLPLVKSDPALRIETFARHRQSTMEEGNSSHARSVSGAGGIVTLLGQHPSLRAGLTVHLACCTR